MNMFNRTSPSLSDFLRYLADHDNQRSTLPSLATLSQELGMSISVLREQLEVARALGLVEVRPRTGIRRLPYSFFPAVSLSLQYALTQDKSLFEAFSSLRNHIEASFWHEAVRQLRPEDHQELLAILASAEEKLQRTPAEIPHPEHRRLHLLIYSRLENPFVNGLLEAYWEAYEMVGLNVVTSLEYLREVWSYHRRMVEAILRGDYEAGYRALIEHTDLLSHRPQPTSSST